MPAPYLPLRCEGMGDQWWYASPIDLAAASGHCDLVRELLLLDPNLIIKLTSLRRIRRLETVWDDEAQFDSVANCRSRVARKLLFESEAGQGRNSLVESGYGGWLLYIAASAGDLGFVKELLERKPQLVFGEGEYGITDMFYAASKCKNSEVFRILLDLSVSPKHSMEVPSVCTFDTMNRAVHAVARAGNLEILKELLKEDCSNILVYRDLEGSTVLHSAAGQGKAEVVKDLVTSFDIITSKDNQGHTALHVAAYFGHLAVVEALILASPSLISITNNAGDTFFHTAVAGFQTPGFRRLDRQKELIEQLIYGNFTDMKSIVNARNKDGKTALHMAVTGNNHPNLVELLMTVPSINLNVHDVDGMTPLDLLVQNLQSASSEILIKKLVSAGGVSNCQDYRTTTSIVSPLKVQAIVTSPGTSFRIPDTELFSYVGIKKLGTFVGDQAGASTSSCSSERSEIETVYESNISGDKRHLKVLLEWPQHKEKNFELEESAETLNPARLRQRFSDATTLVNNKRVLSIRSILPSPSTKKKFSAELMHGVIQATPQVLTPPVQSPSGSPSRSSMSSSNTSLDKNQVTDHTANGDSRAFSLGPSFDNSTNEKNHRNSMSINKKLMNQYFCFGTQGLAVDEPVRRLASQVSS